jgi:selenocysteine-specific elongation factor
MQSLVVGTAGHIDHGKTALVKALTGIDADRLAEEKRRGITIDLGFAHMDLPTPAGETLRIAFVDVPGHERFVRNMLAGVGGIDLVLLVIAADESIKPQTREHFDILQLLGVERGITVLTKSDAVDADTLDVVRLEVEEFLRGTFLDPHHAPLVAVSSLTGAGLDDLKRAIIQTAATIRQRSSHSVARLPVDRVFTMKGFGTVVTGTLLAGAIHREDELEVSPTASRVRVRGVQVHGESADHALAGQRTALNLAGASTTTDDLSRGMTLAPPALLTTTRRADVRLHLLSSAPPLKDRARVHFHCHTLEAVAEISLHESKSGSKQLAPGAHAFARLKLPAPALLVPGDRFVIRQFSPVITIGGGVVLDSAPIPRQKRDSSFLELLATADRPSVLRARIQRRGRSGISLSHLIAETGWTRSSIEADLTPLTKTGSLLRIADLFIDTAALSHLKQSLLAALQAFHQKNPMSPGIGREELREQSSAPPEIFTAALDQLSREKKLDIAAEFIRLPGQGSILKDDEAESKQTIETAFSSAGLKVPALREVLASLKIDKVRAQKIVTLLLRDKLLIKVSDDLVFHQSALAHLRQRIADYKRTHAQPGAPGPTAKIDVGKFKDLTGVSRKYAIPLLE